MRIIAGSVGALLIVSALAVAHYPGSELWHDLGTDLGAPGELGAPAVGEPLGVCWFSESQFPLDLTHGPPHTHLADILGHSYGVAFGEGCGGQVADPTCEADSPGVYVIGGTTNEFPLVRVCHHAELGELPTIPEIPPEGFPPQLPPIEPPPVEPPVGLPGETDGLTARITFPGSIGDVVLVSDADGLIQVEVMLYQKGQAGWAGLGDLDATLRVFKHTGLVEPPQDLLSLGFTTDATGAAQVAFDAATLEGNDGLFDIFVTFSELGGATTPTSHHNIAKNAAIDAGQHDVADGLDHTGWTPLAYPDVPPLSVPEAPLPQGDGITASITFPDGTGDLVLTPDADGNIAIDVAMYRNVSSAWGPASVVSALRIFKDGPLGGEDLVSQMFTPDADGRASLVVGADELNGTGTYDVFITFAALEGSPVPTSHHGLAKNAAIAQEDYDTADQLDYYGGNRVLFVEAPGAPEVPPLPTLPPDDLPEVPPLPEVPFGPNGVTASLTFPSSIADLVLQADEAGNVPVDITLYRAVDGVWGPAAGQYASLRVLKQTGPDIFEDQVLLGFTSDADGRASVAFPAEDLDGGSDGVFDVFVTFALPGSPTSHHGLAKNAAITAGQYDLADALDYYGAMRMVYLDASALPAVEPPGAPAIPQPPLPATVAQCLGSTTVLHVCLTAVPGWPRVDDATPPAVTPPGAPSCSAASDPAAPGFVVQCQANAAINGRPASVNLTLHRGLTPPTTGPVGCLLATQSPACVPVPPQPVLLTCLQQSPGPECLPVTLPPVAAPDPGSLPVPDPGALPIPPVPEAPDPGTLPLPDPGMLPDPISLIPPIEAPDPGTLPIPPVPEAPDPGTLIPDPPALPLPPL